tara:strand:+ start:257 stop:652 length:396 start_codon:yes stop_codon:yes gene_type:complete
LIQKKQDLRPARRTEAGKKLFILIPVQKHTFFPAQTYVWTTSNVNSPPSVQEVNIVTLVSVLDLDNTFVSAGIHLVGRGNSLANACINHRDKHDFISTKPRLTSYSKQPNSVVIVSLFTMSIRPIGRANAP